MKKVKLHNTIPAYQGQVPLFDHYFFVLFGIENWNALCTADPDLKDFLNDNSFGLVVSDEKTIFLYLEEDVDNERGTLAHEIYHLALRIIEARGIKQKDEELVAHVIGYLDSEIRPLVKPRKNAKK